MTRDQHESNKKKVKLTMMEKDLQGGKSLHFKAPTKTSFSRPPRELPRTTHHTKYQNLAIINISTTSYLSS